ncbi:hypothetical protein L226DRAFT_571770 [Lentinus tigrinus ALCF2SS1-7]|uniref:Uncharacterized protein n=1 Tax=Lentinus tigrinus ALCF2SS1-6 TaxID=1328759 RepID=A0A5C2RVU4_9APHY|nr:hypothetical protein L227DRAFT_615974 [Lentinus tigrinus ALCF2SS1-6]RPD73852.1 hypothetical protein L226DRAFT_571770 [Lentinus tigrinus ALCF2SS1-7]
MLNDEVIPLCKTASYALEKMLGDLDTVPFASVVHSSLALHAPRTWGPRSSPRNDYDHSRVVGVCFENVIGYMPLPLGIAGAQVRRHYIPHPDREGTLVASAFVAARTR